MENDALGRVICQRIVELLAARPELKKADFGRRIGRGPSWVSEVLSGGRRINDLRMLIKIGHVLGVTLDYLTGVQQNEPDAGAMTLISTWKTLPPSDQQILLTMASSLRARQDPPA